MSCSFAWSNPYKGLEEKQTQKQVKKTYLITHFEC